VTLIIAANTRSGTSGGGGPDAFGMVDGASAFNLIGDGTWLSGISNADANHNQVGTSGNPIDPRLGPLGNYGGPTQTMPLLPGSPAIDAGTSDGAPVADQRGQLRPVTLRQYSK
jgi:hypothetical protein